MQLPPLGLYIHLPWCERKCPYCDFNSHESHRIPEQDYVTTLLNDLRNDLPLTQDRPIATLFIGGGTPSLFSAQAIAQLMQGISSMVALSPQLEATMEANPGSAEAEKFSAFRAAGINRLSLGIQSFADQQLTALGRIHNGEQARSAIESAHAAGFDNLNLDLMHGLPGQSASAAQEDLRIALEFRPQHLSWYQLTIEPNTVFHKRPPLLPLEDELADIQQQGEQLLSDAGFSQYEVSAYALPQRNSRHNCNYWSFGDYVGIGAGAHGKITLPDGRIQRFAKKRQPKDYMAADAQSYVGSTRELDNSEVIGEFMLNALRLNEGFTLQQFAARTGFDAEVLRPQLDSLAQRELLEYDSERVRATALGRRFLDSVVAEFF